MRKILCALLLSGVLLAAAPVPLTRESLWQAVEAAGFRAGEINAAMPYSVVEAVSSALNQHKKTLNGARILVLGVAYKKDIDDLRESPALTIIELLQKQGTQVSYHDPYFAHVGRGRHYDLNMDRVELSNLEQYDCVLIVTDHSDYDYPKIVKESQLVVDTRNATKGIKSEKIVRC